MATDRKTGKKLSPRIRTRHLEDEGSARSKEEGTARSNVINSIPIKNLSQLVEQSESVLTESPKKTGSSPPPPKDVL